MISTILSLGIVGVIVLAFLLVAARDIGMLFRRPGKGMGTGILRVWAVARTTMLEAWASRVWLLPILWFVVSIVLLLAVRPFDESERIPLYIRVLLTAQEILLLLMIWVMACVSLPRERERKIVITNGSKPLSRLEMLLGKMAGFSLTTLLLLLVMSAVSWGILVVADQRIRSEARAEYQFAETDYRTKTAQMKDAVPPPEDKKRLADEGSLFAANYLTVPDDGMSIVGMFDEDKQTKKMIRYIKGGSEEKAIYHFSPDLPGDARAKLMEAGQRPFFWFYFPVVPYPGLSDPPKRILINVTAVRAKQQLRQQQKTLALDMTRGGQAAWEPDDPTELFSFPGGRENGDIEVTVTCPTPGVFLEVLDGVPKEKASDARQFNIGASSRTGDWQMPLPNPQLRGFERRDRQQVEGPSEAEMRALNISNPPLESAVFRFPGKSLRRIPLEDGKFRLSMVLDVDKEKNQELETLANVEVFSEDAPEESFRTQVTVIEKRSTEVLVPAKMLGNPDLSKRGDMMVRVSCNTPGHWLSLLPDSVRIVGPPSPFLMNLLKSELVLFCEISLLAVICVACSVRLGWPVAMLTAIVCYFLGWLRGFIAEIQDLGGLGALGFPNYGEQSSSYRFADHLLAAVWKFLGFVISLTPDFRRFDALAFIVELRNMPWETLAVDIGWTFLYALPFIGLGYLAIRKQELG